MYVFANLSINRKLLLYFCSLLCLLVLTYGLITAANQKLRTSGAAIELSRQTQNLALQMGFLSSNLAKGEADLAPELKQNMGAFDAYLNLLREGGEFRVKEENILLKPVSADLAGELKQVDKHWKAYQSLLTELLNANPATQSKQIEDAHAAILSSTPLLFLACQEYANAYLERYIADYSFLQMLILGMFVLNLAFIGLGMWLARFFISKPLNTLIESVRGIELGKLDFQLSAFYKDEIGALANTLSTLQKHIGESTAFATKIGEGAFDTDFSAKSSDDKLALALLGMRDNLQRVAVDDKRRNWANEGMAKFSELLRNPYDSVEAMADTLLAGLVKYLNANQGSFFSLSFNEEGKSGNELTQIACFAYNRKKHLKQTLLVGEGLVGQAVLERDTLYLTDIPDEYVKIKSGLGEANPRNILVVPLMVNEQVYGVLELASFHTFETHQIEFVENLSESIASTLANTHNAEQTRSLLEQSQSMTRIMQEQEEEMRQNMEELQATQEEMDRKNRELAVTDKRFGQLASSVDGMLYQYVQQAGQSTSFTYVSPGSLKLLGYSSKEMISAQNLSSVFKIHEEDAEAFKQTFGDSQQKLTDFQWTGRLITRAEEVKWVSMHSKPERLASGEIMWSGLAYDITEQKEKEAVLMDFMDSMQHSQEELQKAVGELESVRQDLQAKQAEVDGLAMEIELLRKQATQQSAQPAAPQESKQN